MNNSTYVSSNEYLSCPFGVQLFYTSSMIVISLATFIGNILVNFLVYKTPSLRTSINCYYVNMAVSDSLSCLTNWAPYLTENIKSNTGYITQNRLSNISCKVGEYFQLVSATVSILNMVLIAVDRFIAIVFPLKATFITRKLRATLLSATWLIPLASYMPILLYNRVTVRGQTIVCALEWNGFVVTVYFISCTIIYSIVPFIAVIILYSRIMKVLRSREMNLAGDASRGNNLKRRRGEQDKNVMKIFKSVVMAYSLCLCPYSVYIVLYDMSNIFDIIDKCMFIRRLCQFLLPALSTAVNSIILFTFSTNFRQALHNLFLFLHSRCRPRCHVLARQEVISLPELVSYKKASE